MSNLTTLPKGDSAWLFRKAIERIIRQISDLETNIGSSTTGNSANTQVIFNDNGVLRGDPDLTFNTALNKLVATALESTTSLVVGTSATITGDLTVRTNRLATTTTGVGIGTSSPILPLDVRSGAGAGALFLRTTDPTAAVSSAYIQTPVSTGFSALVPIYGFWYQNCGMGNPASDAVTLITASTERYRIDSAGTNTWSNVGGAGTAMTLNSTGLGVGASPANGKLIVGADATTDGNGSWNTTLRNTVGAATTAPKTGLSFSGYWNGTSNFANFAGISGGKENTTDANTAGMLTMWTSPNGGSPTTRLTIDSSGNVGIGVTPSAFGANQKALQVGSFASIYNDAFNGAAVVGFNVYQSANSTYNYIATGITATRYEQRSASHFWYSAGSGTAGQTTTVTSGNSYTITAAGGTNYTTFGAANNNVGTTFTATSSGTGNGGGVTQNITFTQAMTLSATGQLLLGTSSTNGGVDIGMVMNKPSATGFVGNVYQLNGVDKAFAYIASAASAYTTETVSGYIIRAVSATNGVYLANGGTSWLALSDERFKDIIEPISNAVAKVCSLRSVIGKFKTESEGTRRPFLIAQDVQAVLPEAVDATKPDQLGVSYSDVIPLLVAAIKELTARVQTLETR